MNLLSEEILALSDLNTPRGAWLKCAERAITLESRAAQLEDLVARLPVTADGVRVVPFVDAVYLRNPTKIMESFYIERLPTEATETELSEEKWFANFANYDVELVSECYSTRQACEAALQPARGEG